MPVTIVDAWQRGWLCQLGKEVGDRMVKVHVARQEHGYAVTGPGLCPTDCQRTPFAQVLSARRERRRRTPTRRPCTVAKGGGGPGGEEENVARRGDRAHSSAGRGLCSSPLFRESPGRLMRRAM